MLYPTTTAGTVYLQQVPLLSLARYNDAMHLPTQVVGRWLMETKKERVVGKCGVSHRSQIGLLDCAQCVCQGKSKSCKLRHENFGGKKLAIAANRLFFKRAIIFPELDENVGSKRLCNSSPLTIIRVSRNIFGDDLSENLQRKFLLDFARF